MCLSKRSSIDTQPQFDSTSTVRGTLASDQLQVVDCLYLKVLPEYKNIVCEYDQACRRAAVSREKSRLPPRSQWSPPGRELTSKERDLLCGPRDTAIFLKKITVRDSDTGREITYSVCRADERVLPHVCSSYVCVKNEHNAVPKFGRIVSLFQHNFYARIFNWAVIHEYSKPTRNKDSGLCMVGLASCNSQPTTILLDNLSYPLVFAKDGGNLWFLNY